MKKSSFLIPMAGLFCLAVSGQAAGKTFTVSTAQELQAALAEAQTNNESDVINLQAGRYETVAGKPFTFKSADGFDLALVGNEFEPTQVVLSGSHTSDVLTLSNGKSGGTFALIGLTIEGGRQGLKTKNANTHIEFCAFKGKPSSATETNDGAPVANEQLTILSSVFTGQTPPVPGPMSESGRIDPSSLEQAGNWVLLGTSVPITDMSQFNEFNAVWSYQNGEWKAYSAKQDIKIRAQTKGVAELTTIPAHSGFWVWRD